MKTERQINTKIRELTKKWDRAFLLNKKKEYRDRIEILLWVIK